MNTIKELLDKYCPDGVEYKKLGEVAEIVGGRDYKHLSPGNIPVYGSGGVMTYVDDYAYNQPTVLLPRKGSISNVFYVDKPFWNVDTIFYTKIKDYLLPKYLYYYICNCHIEKLNTSNAARPALTRTVLNNILIPVPPLPVQREIVRILDSFTSLEAELEAELEARRKQYEYYRDQLLSFKHLSGGGRDEVEWKTLGEIGEVCMCKRIMKNQTKAEGCIPFYKIGTFGKTADAFISEELYEEYKQKYSFPRKGEVLISAAGTIGRAVIYDGEPAYFQDSNIVWIANDESLVLNKYLYYFYSVADWRLEGGTIKRLYNNNLKAVKIPIPPLSTQRRIVSVLDRFESLVNDISTGLPAEIAARHQQYEYYRDQLLSFKRKS